MGEATVVGRNCPIFIILKCGNIYFIEEGSET